MSWDVFLFHRNPEDPSSPGAPLGSRADVAEAVKRVFPRVDFSDPAWGVVSDDEWSIEVNVGGTEPVESVMLHVRGGGDADLAVLTLADALGCGTLDCSTGEPVEPDGENGWAGFQEFRDRVLGGS